MENDNTIYDNNKKAQNPQFDPEATDLVNNPSTGACPPPLPDGANGEFPDESTNLDPNYNPEFNGEQPQDFMPAEEGAPAAQEEKKSGVWRNVVIGGVSGIMFGAGATLLTSAITSDKGEEPVEKPEPVKPEPETNPNEHPLTDGEVPLAHNVNDSMSFAEAFAAARAEVGPGGVFEWHGQLYGTYYADEWNSMSAAERAEYNSHFAWSGGSHTGGSHASGGSHGGETHHHEEPVKPVTPDKPVGPDKPVVTHDDDIKTVSIDGHEIKVATVVHNSDGTNHAAVAIDGHPAVLTDLNGDGVFDYIITDTNGDNVINGNELIEMNFRVTTDDLGGAHDSEVGPIEMGQQFGFKFDLETPGPEPVKPVAQDGMEVIHDNSTGQNWAYISADGKTRILADLDGDGKFDGLMNDYNGDGKVSMDEIVDVRDAGFTVEGFGGITASVDNFNPQTLTARAGWQVDFQEEPTAVPDANLMADADVNAEGARSINPEEAPEETAEEPAAVETEEVTVEPDGLAQIDPTGETVMENEATMEVDIEAEHLTAENVADEAEIEAVPAEAETAPAAGEEVPAEAEDAPAMETAGDEVLVAETEEEFIPQEETHAEATPEADSYMAESTVETTETDAMAEDPAQQELIAANEEMPADDITASDPMSDPMTDGLA